jgi:hypothetical protein|tara:strand:+ start:247 stop:465 length:219 start_codon:yes stop_codon:yes gene_type:complete
MVSEHGQLERRTSYVREKHYGGLCVPLFLGWHLLWWSAQLLVVHRILDYHILFHGTLMWDAILVHWEKKIDC